MEVTKAGISVSSEKVKLGHCLSLEAVLSCLVFASCNSQGHLFSLGRVLTPLSVAKLTAPCGGDLCFVTGKKGCDVMERCSTPTHPLITCSFLISTDPLWAFVLNNDDNNNNNEGNLSPPCVSVSFIMIHVLCIRFINNKKRPAGCFEIY